MAKAVFQSPLVQLLDGVQVRLARFLEALGQQGDTVLRPFAVSYRNLMIRNVHVLHPQAQVLAQLQPDLYNRLAMSHVDCGQSKPGPAVRLCGGGTILASDGR